MLHDIGKIRQRDVINESHASLGSEFVRELYNLEEKTRRRVADLVRLHHTKLEAVTQLTETDKKLLSILKLADVTSAAHDRDDLDPKEFGEDPRMHRIFQYVNLDENRETDKPCGNSMFPLITVQSLIGANFSKKTGKFFFNDITYKKLYKDLLSECQSVSASNIRGFLNTLDSILLNYAVLVPSAFYYSEPNVSLYDHLRLTASLAMVMHRGYGDGKDDPKSILVMGDVSGIQDYIFSHMVSEGVDDKATKRMRGRSFMVRLITDSVISYLLHEFKLYRFNVIWEKSDGFLIMLDYSNDNLLKLEEIRKNVERGLEVLNRGPRMFLSWKVVNLNDLADKKRGLFSKNVSGINVSINERKKRLLFEWLPEGWEEISGIENTEMKICKFCGRGKVLRNDRCLGCLLEESIGDNIVKRNIISRYDSGSGEISFNYGVYSCSYSFLDDAGSAEIIKINSFEIDNRYSSQRSIIQGNYSPRNNNGGVVSINDLLCSHRDENRRCLYLGVSKSDVDNMGTIITEGLRPVTLSKYASLSTLTGLFFSVLVNRIAEEHGVYLIYSGGDDLLAMGESLNVVGFSQSVRGAFGMWVNNDQITLSTGVEVVDSHYPVRRAVDLASDVLSEAKLSPGKNSLGIFGLTIPWKEISDLENIIERLMHLVVKNKITDRNSPALGRNFSRVLLDLDNHSPYSGPIQKGKKVKIPDAYLSYYLNRNSTNLSLGEIRSLLAEMTRKEIFQYIRYVAYRIILEQRREDYVSRQEK